MTEDSTIVNAFTTVISKFSQPLFHKISKYFAELNKVNVHDPNFDDILERTVSFDASFDCIIDKCISLLILDPKDCFKVLFNFFVYPDLNQNANFCPSTISTNRPEYLLKLDSKFTQTDFVAKKITYFIIDKLVTIFLLRLLRKLDNMKDVNVSDVFHDFFFLHFNKTPQPQDTDGFDIIQPESEFDPFTEELRIQKLNAQYWIRIIHFYSQRQPIEAYIFFIGIFQQPNKSVSLAILLTFLRSFPFDSLSDDNIRSLTEIPSFKTILSLILEKVSKIDEIHISGSLFFMNLTARELLIKKRWNTDIIQLILEKVQAAITYTPIALPIASIFVIFSQHNQSLTVNFDSETVISNALSFLSNNNSISGSFSILILNTFIHLLSATNDYFNDIYLNGIQLRSFPLKCSLSNDRIQTIYPKVLSYGSFNDPKYELTNLLLIIASIDFHSFVTEKLDQIISNKIFVRFNSYPLFYFFREVLINDTIKTSAHGDYIQFQKIVLDFFIKYQNEKAASKVRIFSINTIAPKNLTNSFELIQCARDECFVPLDKQITFEPLFINHLYEFVNPKPMIFSSSSKKSDIESWSPILAMKKGKTNNFFNCTGCRENQPIALLLSLFPLLNPNIDHLLSIVPLLFSLSPQISSMAVFVLRYYIQKDSSMINPILNELLQQEIVTIEHLFNALYFINHFVSVSDKNNSQVFDHIKEILMIGLCSDRREIRNLVFSITDKLNLFDVFDSNQCFQSFYRKLIIVSSALSTQTPNPHIIFRPYRYIALTNYEYIHSIYLSVIFDGLKLEFSDQSLTLIKNFLMTLKSTNENEMFIFNLLTFLAFHAESSNLLKFLYSEFSTIKDNFILINYASSFHDILAITNHFIESPVLLSSILLIQWHRFPLENTISIFLNVIPEIINQLYSETLDKFFPHFDGQIINDMNTIFAVTNLLHKMFRFFYKSHSGKPISLFLRNSFCPDIFEFFHYKNKKEIVLKFILFASFPKISSAIGRKALHSFCSVTVFDEPTIPYFDLFGLYPETIRAIVCQSPKFIDLMIKQLELGDQSSYSIIASLFAQISSTVDSAEILTEHLNTLYDNYLFGLNNKIESTDELTVFINAGLDFTNLIYNITGKIIATSLLNFPSNDSINTLKNLALGSSFIKIFIQNQNEQKVKNHFLLLLNFLDNPINDLYILSKYLSESFNFCLDQFLKEAFTLINNAILPNFVLALSPWMKLINFDLEICPLTLSTRTDDCFRFVLTSISLVKIICQFNLYDLMDILINSNKENVETLLILSIRYRKEKFIQRILQNMPMYIDYIKIYFDCNYWRYQVIQLRKLGDEFYNQIQNDMLNITPNQQVIIFNQNNDDIFEIPKFLLNSIIPIWLVDNFNLFLQLAHPRTSPKSSEDLVNSIDDLESFDFDKLYTTSLTLNETVRIQHLINHVGAFCIAFRKKDFVQTFVNNNPLFMKCIIKDDTFFSCLYQWAVFCGDIDASLNSTLYLVQNFKSFKISGLSPNLIDKIIETITILTLSINNKNQTKTMKITGDDSFSFVPYYNYIAALIELLSLITISSHKQLVSKLIQCTEIISKVFCFLCEFFLTSNKTFSMIFEKVVHSLYLISDISVCINNSTNITTQQFEGIFLLIVKNDVDFAKNCTPEIVEQIGEIATSLLLKSHFYLLIGDIDRFNYDKDKKKSNIASIALFLLPFWLFSKSSSISSFITKEFNLNPDQADNTIDILLEHCVHPLLNFVFHFYSFCAKNRPSMLSDTFDISRRILASNKISLQNEPDKIELNKNILLKLKDIALTDEDSTNSMSTCSYIEQYHHIGGTFESISVPPNDSRFPVTNLPFDLDACFLTRQSSNELRVRATRSSSVYESSVKKSRVPLAKSLKMNFPHSQSSIRMVSNCCHYQSNEIIETVDYGCQPVYFPSAYDFLSLEFVKEIREQECARCKIQPFTKWVDMIFKAENAQNEIEKSGDSSQQLDNDGNKFDLHKAFSTNTQKGMKKLDVQSIMSQFCSFVRNSIHFEKSVNDLNQDKTVTREVKKDLHRTSSLDNNRNELFSIDMKLFTPNIEDIDSIYQDSFPTVFP